MKRFAFFLFVIFSAYIIQYDITHGTLPSIKHVPTAGQEAPNVKTTSTSSESKLPYLKMKVKAGDTVLSIVEQTNQGPVPVPIEQLVEDFKALNKGVTPQNIQIGKEYKFPFYKKET